MPIPKTGKLRLSKHALARMSERAIKKEYIQNAVDFGEVKYFAIWYDKHTGARKKNIKEYYLEIPDKGRLIVVIGADYGLVITAFFDIPTL